MGSFVSCWTVINIVSEHRSGCNGPNVATLASNLMRFLCSSFGRVTFK